MHGDGAGQSWIDRIRQRLALLFPRCQILIRTDRRLRYVSIGGGLQLAIAAALLLSAGWTVFATAHFIDHTATLAARDQQIDDNRIAYRGLLADVSTYQERFFAIAEELEDNQQLMLDLVEQGVTLQRALQATQTSLEGAEGRPVSATNQRIRPNDQSAAVEGNLSLVVKRNAQIRERLVAAQIDLSIVLGEGERAARTQHAASRHLEALEQQIAELRGTLENAIEERRLAASQSTQQAHHITTMEAQLNVMQAARRDAVQRLHEHVSEQRQDGEALRASLLAALGERDRSLLDQRRMDERVQVLEYQISSIHSLQRDALQRLKEQTAQHIVTLEKVVGLTGLSVGSLIGGDAVQQGSGQGGPFIAFEDDGGEEAPGERMIASLTTLGQQLGHWETLQDVLRRIPIVAPLRTYQVNSDFGKRQDPLNKMWAMHTGIDLGGPADAPVLATAPGIVTFAGWRGRHGNAVEIDHGTGIVTLYAHLDSIKVKTGQRVEFQQQIGVLGDSGRSTGMHLHYEVTYKGKPMDPMRFIKAGQHVFQDSQKKQ